MKEIGIRKVLGATMFSGFLGMILVAFAIAAQVAGWLMNRWLQGMWRGRIRRTRCVRSEVIVMFLPVVREHHPRPFAP
jgi:uncharacterized membrane protein YcjF (UPF0283 family)